VMCRRQYTRPALPVFTSTDSTLPPLSRTVPPRRDWSLPEGFQAPKRKAQASKYEIQGDLSSVVLINDVCTTALPEDIEWLVERAGVLASSVKDIAFQRHIRKLCLTGRVQIIFDTVATAEKFARMSKDVVIGAKRITLQYIEQPSVKTPTLFADAKKRCVLIGGYPHNVEVEDIERDFVMIEKDQMATNWIQAVEPSSPWADYKRFLIRLANMEEADRVLREKHLSYYDFQRFGRKYRLNADLMF